MVGAEGALEGEGVGVRALAAGVVDLAGAGRKGAEVGVVERAVRVVGWMA